MADVKEIQEYLGENLIFRDYSLRENDKTRQKQQVEEEGKTFLGGGQPHSFLFHRFICKQQAIFTSK